MLLARIIALQSTHSHACCVQASKAKEKAEAAKKEQAKAAVVEQKLQELIEQIEADAEKQVGFSDEDDVEVVVVDPDKLVAYGSKSTPKKKKKKGGQRKGSGRKRVAPMFFDPNSDLFKDDEVVKQAKDRFQVVRMDMCEWFRDPDNKKLYGGQVDGFLADLPYGNQRGNHGQDPLLSTEVALAVAQGMYEFGATDCIACLGCGDIEQVCCHCRCRCC